MPKAQSAMEFMLTYGWAILVVMVVGSVMWRIGVFDLGSSITPTSSGFAQLKPLLVSCMMTETNWAFLYNGFICQFTNTLPSDLRFTDINVTVDGETCNYFYVTTSSTEDAPVSTLFRRCNDRQGDCPTIGCWNTVATACDVATNELFISQDSTFFIATDTFYNTAFDGVCETIDPGKPYSVFISATYKFMIGGVEVTKRDSGYIRGAQE